MVEPSDPVLIKSDEDAAGGARYYSAQLGLRFKMQPHFFRTHSQLEVTCVSRVGLHSGSDVLEGRAKWVVRHPAASGRQAPVSPVSKWPKHQRGSSKKNDEEEEVEEDEDDEDDDEDDDDFQLGIRRDEENASWNATLFHSGSSDSDGTAQSISDSESPSRRTQPVVGSYPGENFHQLVY